MYNEIQNANFFTEQQKGTFFICKKDSVCSQLGEELALKADGLIRCCEMYIWSEDSMQPLELEPGTVSGLLIIFVQGSAKGSELLLFPQISCDVTPG